MLPFREFLIGLKRLPINAHMTKATRFRCDDNASDFTASGSEWFDAGFRYLGLRVH